MCKCKYNRQHVVHLCFNTCTAHGDLLRLRNLLYLRHSSIHYTACIICIYYIHSKHVEHQTTLHYKCHKKKKYNLTHFCELKAGWSYRLTLSCLALARHGQQRCNWMSQREMRAKPLLYSSGHMPEWRPHYWNGHTCLKKLTDFERLILLVYKYLDERAYRILSTFEYNWISSNLWKALHDPEGSEKSIERCMIFHCPDLEWPWLILAYPWWIWRFLQMTLIHNLES